MIHPLILVALLLVIGCAPAPMESTIPVPASSGTEEPLPIKPHGTVLSPQARYRATLEALGRDVGEITLDQRPGFSGFQYAFHGSYQDRCLVSSEGVVGLHSGAGWYILLSSGPTDEVAQAVVWMKGKASLAEPTGPGPDAEVVGPEIVVLPDGSRRLTMHIGEPPSFTPVLLTVTAPPSGDATLVWGGTRPR